MKKAALKNVCASPSELPRYLNLQTALTDGLLLRMSLIDVCKTSIHLSGSFSTLFKESYKVEKW